MLSSFSAPAEHGLPYSTCSCRSVLQVVRSSHSTLLCSMRRPEALALLAGKQLSHPGGVAASLVRLDSAFAESAQWREEGRNLKRHPAPSGDDRRQMGSLMQRNKN